ncbi:class F sortase [Ktedonobacteria bacterium brp13]|nr:class F sortase [Ktedonobacteria bacterium brp13]
MMRIKQRYLFILAIGIVMLGIGGGIMAWRSVLSFQNSIHKRPVDQPSIPQPQIGLNILSGAHLLIPSIGVDAPIESVGRDATGHMGVPTKHRWDGVAWYQNGPTPGQLGSSVIDGHLDKVGGAPAVFWNLHKLRIGDMVSVQDKSHHTLHFQVTKIADYGTGAAPLSQIFGKHDGTYLNLITCSGSWSFDENQYLQRLVVFTRLVS